MPNSVIAAADRALSGFSSQFKITARSGGIRSWEWLALVLIVVVAAAVRLWGLDGWGLEGDEDTMALPATHILKYGTSYLPSGMFYPRGLAQLYMMAGSMMAFGESAWAMRLPSVICGVLLVALAYPYGRRFLAPAWNIAFVAAVAFLPGMIADSQEARMYIFLIACLAGYTALIFAWERTDRLKYLAYAVILMLIGIQFHTLAVFGAFIVFFPGLLHSDRRRLIWGALAFAIIVAGFEWMNYWIGSFYPPHPPMTGLEKIVSDRTWGLNNFHGVLTWVILAETAAAVLAVFTVKRGSLSRFSVIAMSLIFAGLTGLILFCYHAGTLLLVAGVLVAQRNGGVPLKRLAMLAAAIALLAAVQIYALHAAGVPSLRKIIGVMMGLPSVWTYLNLAAYSPGAGLIVCAGVIGVLWQVFMGKKVSDIWLFFLLSIWLPLLGLGLFTWYPEPRYTEFALLPLLLCACAAWQGARNPDSLADSAAQTAIPPKLRRPGCSAALAAAGCLFIVNPAGVARVVDAGYTIHPDHQGAAAFVKSLSIGPHDIVVAEDVIEQTYYLDHVDYWLFGQNVAVDFVEEVQGRILDIYTHTPVIGTGAELSKLLEQPGRGAIYVIGSGENQGDDRRFMRSNGIYEVLKSGAFKRIYLGRDGLTEVLKADDPRTAAGVR
jgi:hypothetical protein